MTTDTYTLDAKGLLHDSAGRFVSRAVRIAWELAKAHANMAAAGLAIMTQLVTEATAAQLPQASWNTPVPKLWKVEERRIATARAFGWV